MAIVVDLSVRVTASTAVCLTVLRCDYRQIGATRFYAKVYGNSVYLCVMCVGY
jgi:hypothetical protein